MDNIILRGTVGSTAYGLDTDGSDVDKLGVYVAPIHEVLGLRGPQAVSESRVTNGPDQTLHEVGKFLSLALKGNPTILELLWLPEYDTRTVAGSMIIAARQSFLSEAQVRNSYGGYAMQQATRLVSRAAEGKEGFGSVPVNRIKKHGRHCMRLLRMGRMLLQTGVLDIDCRRIRDEIFEAGELAARSAPLFYSMFEVEMEEFNRADSVLPERPDRDKVERILQSIRLHELFGLA